MSKHQSFIELFSSPGKSWDLFESKITNLQKFTYHLYGYRSDTINLQSYKLYCSKKEKVDKLPPCKSSLTQHYSRANYQWHVWGLSLEAFTTITSPQDYGWTIDTNGISINWIFCKPAPEEIILYSSANLLKLTCYYVHLFTEVITLAKFTEVITLAKFTEVIALVKFT